MQIKIRVNPASLFQKASQAPTGAPAATGKKPTSGIPIPGLAQATSGIPIPNPNAGQMLLAHLLRGGASDSSPPSSSTIAQAADASVASPKVKAQSSAAVSSPAQVALSGPSETGGGGAGDAKPVRKPLALVRRGEGLGDINAFGGVVMAKGPDKDKTDRGFKLKRSPPVPYSPPPAPTPSTSSSPPPASGSDAMKRVMQLLRTKSTGSEGGADHVEAPAPAPIPSLPQAVEPPYGPSSTRAAVALDPVTAGQAIKSLLRINGAAAPTTATITAPPHPSSSPPPGPQAPPMEAMPPAPMPMPGYPPHMVMPPPYGFPGYPMGAMPMGGAFPRGGPMPPAPPPQAYMYYPPPYGQQPQMPMHPMQAPYMAPPQAPVGGAVPRRAKKTDAAGRGSTTSSMMMPSQVLRMNKAAPAAVSGPEPEGGGSDASGGAAQG